MGLPEKVAARILHLCRERKVTINRLAALSGLRQSTIDSIIKGKTKHPQLNTIKTICDGLGITLVQFFDSPEFMEPERKDDSNE